MGDFEIKQKDLRLSDFLVSIKNRKVAYDFEPFAAVIV
jgi:hypothetical protein